MDMLVHHERIRADIVRLHNIVRDPVEPVEVTRLEEQDGAGDRCGEVEDQMGEHDDVRLDTDNLPCNSDIALQKSFQNRRKFCKIFHVPGHEDSGLKLFGTSMIERFQSLYSLFIRSKTIRSYSSQSSFQREP